MKIETNTQPKDKHGIKWSAYTIILIGLIYVGSLNFFKMYHTGIVAGGDSWGYYLYLPAIFIHDDLANLQTSVASRNLYHNNPAYTSDNPLGVEETKMAWGGNQVNKYTIGLAILYSPFFFAAHGLAKFLNQPADGYSPIYIYLIHLSSLFYALAGFILLRKVLLRFFSEAASAITILLVGLATNLYYFTVYNSAMAHSYLFALYCALLYVTIKFYEQPGLIKAILIGFCAGFITLIRPTEIICLFIPIFWNVTSKTDFSGRVIFFRQEFKLLLAAVGAFTMAGLPQLIYWKIITGHYLYYSYGEEGFDFLHPRVLMGVFGFRNGWLSYTPIMYLALIGLFFIYRNKAKAVLLPTLLFLPVHIYIIYSWWCWYYINGFGSRPMVETYALLSIPMACTIAVAIKRKLLAALLIPVSVFFIGQNIFNTYQVSIGVLWSELGNWSYYKGLFGKTKLDYWDLVRMDLAESQPDENSLVKIKTLFQNNFEDSVSANFTSTDKAAGKYAFILDKTVQFCPGYEAVVSTIGIDNGDWLRISVDCANKQQGFDLYKMNMVVVEFRAGDKTKFWKRLRLDNKVGNPYFSLWGGDKPGWGKVHFWIEVPDNIKPSDKFVCYMWNQDNPTIYLDNFTIEQYKNK